MNASELSKELFYKPKHGYDLLDAQMKEEEQV